MHRIPYKGPSKARSCSERPGDVGAFTNTFSRQLVRVINMLRPLRLPSPWLVFDIDRRVTKHRSICIIETVYNVARSGLDEVAMGHVNLNGPQSSVV